jgi:Domain of unknown function (DUF3597)
VNLFECIRQRILNHAVAAANAPICATGRATTSEHVQPVHGLKGQQVAAVLSSMDAQGSERLRWQTSIVDLMKLLELDPSLSNLAQLGHELAYEGDCADTAAMNSWLHRALMRKLTNTAD